MMKPEALARAEKACGRRDCRRAQSGYSLRGLVQSTGLSVGVGAGPTAIVQRQASFLYKPRPTQGRQGSGAHAGAISRLKWASRASNLAKFSRGGGLRPPAPLRLEDPPSKKHPRQL